jgi:hypothetical protein
MARDDRIVKTENRHTRAVKFCWIGLCRVPVTNRPRPTRLHKQRAPDCRDECKVPLSVLASGHGY